MRASAELPGEIVTSSGATFTTSTEAIRRTSGDAVETLDGVFD